MERQLPEVTQIDTIDNRTLNHQISDKADISRVEAEAIAVGSNEKYRVEKQKSIDVGAISYFCMDRAIDGKHLNWYEITQEPFSETRFLQLETELGFTGFSTEFE